VGAAVQVPAGTLDPMATSGRSPRVWIDVELGATFGRPAASIDIFHEFSSAIGPPTEAWFFHRDRAPLVRGFYYPLVAHERYGVPKGVGPHVVLIGAKGDHLWLSGASCGPGQGAAAATTVLAELAFHLPARAGEQEHSPLARYDEMHYVDGQLSGHRHIKEQIPGAAPGKTFVRGRRLVNRMEFDKGGVTATDFRDIWAMATEPHAWLGRPTSLILYDSRRRSEESGHDGCQLIATGETGRDLWLQLPEPDDYDRLAPGRQRTRYEGAYTEYQAVKQSIFRAVGIEIDPPDDRPLRHKLVGRHRLPPDLIHWARPRSRARPDGGTEHTI
jgi:hypothetical protein